MNGTIARLTFSTLLSRWRGIMLALLPVALIALAVLFRLLTENGSGTLNLLREFNLATIVPLIALIIGTGAISTEIDDGSIVYLLMKPIRRGTVILTKFVVAVSATILFAVVPTVIAAVILTGEFGSITVGFSLAVLIASVLYCGLFLMIGVLTKQAVIVGLGYILILETMFVGFIPNLAVVSIRQWASALAEKITDAPLVATINVWTAGALAGVLIVGSLWYASRRLRALNAV